MNAPTHPTHRINATPRGDNNPRGPALVRYERRLWHAVVGWMLVLLALGAATWARYQPAEWSAGKVVLAVVIFAAIAVGVAMVEES